MRFNADGGVHVDPIRIARATILRHPVERAVVAFAIKSLTRSRRHRLLIAIYVGVGLAFVIGSFLRPYVRDGITMSLDEPSAALLSIPFVLSFFLLVALRVLFSVPTEIRANWIFQMTESRDKSAYVGGVPRRWRRSCATRKPRTPRSRSSGSCDRSNVRWGFAPTSPRPLSVLRRLSGRPEPRRIATRPSTTGS